VVSDVQVTGRLAFATPSTVTVSTANKVGLMLFDGLSCGIGAPANAMASRNGPC
jgi:hypothetical protein